MGQNTISLHEEVLHYQGDGAQIRAVYCRPDAPASYPGIVLLHDVHGVIDHVQRLARSLAGQGYAVLAPDLFTRGDGPGLPPKREVMAKMADLPDPRIVNDVDAAVMALKSQQGVVSNRIAVMGFSLGARYTMFICGRRPDIAAAVMFYGILVYPKITEFRPVQPLDSVARFGCPALVIFGEADALVPMRDVDRLEGLLKQHGKRYEMYRYPGVNHGFFNDQLKTHDARASTDAWDKTLGFLGRHLKKG